MDAFCFWHSKKGVRSHRSRGVERSPRLMVVNRTSIEVAYSGRTAERSVFFGLRQQLAPTFRGIFGTTWFSIMVNIHPFLVEGRHDTVKKVGIGSRGYFHLMKSKLCFGF